MRRTLIVLLSLKSGITTAIRSSPSCVAKSSLYSTSRRHTHSPITASVPKGGYEVVLDTDAKSFGGNGFNDDSMVHFTNFDPLYAKDGKEWLQLYLPARTALALRLKHEDEEKQNNEQNKTKSH